MKISKIIIPGGSYPPFKDFELDLTYPEGHAKAGQPLDKICLIGRSGTGKTRLLELTQRNLLHLPRQTDKAYWDGCNAIHRLTLSNGEEVYSILYNPYDKGTTGANYKSFILPTKLDQIRKDWIQTLFIYNDIGSLDFYYSDLALEWEKLKEIVYDLMVFVNTDSAYENIDLDQHGMPKTKLNEALGLFKKQDLQHTVNGNTSNLFWKQLIFHIKKRENDFQEYLKANRDKAYGELEDEFDKIKPSPLIPLAEIWNKFLNLSHLYFDIKEVKTPIQLTDNLEVNIRSKTTGEIVGYNNLSSGTKNFLFQIGHIFALYHNRKIEKGLLLVDEPEKSLFPDFQTNLIYDVYESILKDSNTQLFVATHSPIIAAQFDPAERVILDFDDEGKVIARKGTAPEGDDPNDVLKKDFGIESLANKVGQESWKKYRKLRREVRDADDKAEQDDKIKQYLELGRAYDFPKADSQ